MSKFTISVSVESLSEAEALLRRLWLRPGGEAVPRPAPAPLPPQEPGNGEANGEHKGPWCPKCRVEAVLKTGTRKADGQPYSIYLCPKCKERVRP